MTKKATVRTGGTARRSDIIDERMAAIRALLSERVANFVGE